jgi:hypothetical protein
MEAMNVRIFPAIGIYPMTIYASKYLITAANSQEYLILDWHLVLFLYL